MFDTMTVTKVTGALCGSLLIYLLGGWAAEALYHAPAGDGHGGEVKQAYVVAVAQTAGAASGEQGPDFATLYAAADPARGEKVFKKCGACHKLDGTDGVGPHLNGVVDRAKASVSGFGYSDVLLGMASETWTPENLDGFLLNPKKYAPGTKMSFAGLPKAEERADLIVYLATIK